MAGALDELLAQSTDTAKAVPSIAKPGGALDALLAQPLTPGTGNQESGPLPTRAGLTSLLPKKEELPELIGSMAGGFRAEPGMGTALAAGGAALGEGVRQAFFEDKPLTPKERFMKLAAAGARGAIGEGAGRAIGKAFTMFRGGVTPEIKAATAIAEREGIEAPVSNLVDNRFVQMSERALEYSPFGSGITKQKLAALDKFKDFAGRIGEKINANTAPEVTGAMAKEQTIAFKEAYDQAKDKLYDAVMPKVKDMPVDVTNTINTLQDVIKRRSGTAEPGGLDQVRKWLDDLMGKKIPSQVLDKSGKPYEQKLTSTVKTFEELRKLRTNIGLRGKFNDPAISGMNTEMSNIYAAISNDLDKTASLAGDDISQALKQADEFYAAGKNTLKSKVYKALVNAPQDTLYRVAFVPKSPMHYDMVKDIVGQDTMKDLSGQWYAQITKTKEGILSPKKLLSEFDKYDGTIQKIASDFPEVGQKFGELKQVATLLSKGRDVATGSQTTPSMLGLGVLYSNILYSINKLFTGNLKESGVAAATAAAQVAGSGLGVAGIKSKLGRELLTTGLPRAGKFVGRIAQVGSQLGLEKASE